MQERNVNKLSAAMLLASVLSLQACGTILPAQPQTCPALPAMPSASESQPQKTYTNSAQDDIQGWRKQLADTPLTP